MTTHKNPSALDALANVVKQLAHVRMLSQQPYQARRIYGCEGKIGEDPGGMILIAETKDTMLTSKGTTSIPAAIRQEAELFPGSRIAWKFESGEIRGRWREGGASQTQSHIRKYAGTWQGHYSDAELLRRTRP